MEPLKSVLRGIIVLFLLCTAGIVFAREEESGKEKPKIGLVLSGGGAKGLAHIGVLKVLEEAGIRPDIITGTSMGSIVGSLYAAGYTVEELTQINKNADWEQLLTDDEQLRKVAMDEKRETKKYLIEIPIKDKKIDLPAGLIEGQHLEAYFSELFWPLTSEEDFNEFPIPFHCMSVDMVSGKTIEHRSGNIVSCIRASMSIPTVFSPVKMDSMLLVDGGVTRNFPVQEAIDMGAEVIIGVYVGYQEDVKASDLSSMTDILQRSIALAGIVDAREQFPKCDILIVPDMGGYTSADFTKGAIIQQLGEDAARKQYDEIKALAGKYNCKYELVDKFECPPKILVTDFEVEGLQYLDKKYVISKSGMEEGDSLTYNDINEAIEFMHGTRHFGKLTYHLKRNDKKEGYVLVFDVKENPRAQFKIAPAYDDDMGVGIVTNFTLRNIVAPASRMLISLNIAENPGMEISLNKFVGKKQRLSDRFYMKGYGYKLPYYESGDRLGNYKQGYFEGGYGLQYLLGLNHQIGGNVFYKHNKITPRSDLRSIYKEADFEHIKSNDWGYHLFYKVNTTDDLYFPKRGIKLDVDFAHSLSAKSDLKWGRNPSDEYFVAEGDDPYATLLVEHNWYKTFARRITYNFGVSAGFCTEDAGMNGIYMLGGSQFGSSRLHFKNLAGYNFAELYVSNFAAVKSAVSIELATGLYLTGTVNMVNTTDSYKDIFKDLPDKKVGDYIWGYNCGIKYDSLLGPIQLLLADNNKDGETRFHFSIGFPF